MGKFRPFDRDTTENNDDHHPRHTYIDTRAHVSHTQKISCVVIFLAIFNALVS